MAEQPGRGAPQQGRTDFESMTHEQLAALLDSASSEGASHLATKLSKASSTITKIGDDLMTYVKGLEWQGEGGDAFRDWGGQSAAATLRLGQYAEVASRWMATVAQAVAEAKAAMPATSETTQAKADLADARKTIAATQEPGARNDPDARKLAQTAQSDATAAQQRMEAARAEAIQQLRKLAQTYEYSAYQVNSVPPPTFAPPAEHLDAAEWQDEERASYVSLSPGGSSAASTYSALAGTGGGGAETPSSARSGLPATQPESAPTPNGERVTYSRPVAMEIDSVATLPDTRVSATQSTVPPMGNGPRPDVSSPMPPAAVPPAMSGRSGMPGPVAPPRATSAARPSLSPGQGTSAGGVPRGPRDTGIVGGRPVSPGAGRPPTGLPRGTVIGGDSSQGRMPIGRVSTPGVPMSGSPMPGQGIAPGARRLASETGGVIGNRPLHPGRTGGMHPFTPGGAGLVRRPNTSESATGSAAGRTAGGAHTARPSSRRDNQRDQDQRPDYLSEAEETWARRNHRSVPPVVD